jgi:methionyl-tRNA formyltransferase
MRIIFMGTPDFAVPTLDALVAAGHDVVAVYTQPPRPANRGKRETPSPVHLRADALGLMVRHPTSLKSTPAQTEFAALEADAAVVAAYGLILPQAILDAPRSGCLNVHGSILPRWRGAAPVQRAILAGDRETGVAIMQMDGGRDTGPVRLNGRTSIAGKTAGELTTELAELGAMLMVKVLADLSSCPPMPQPTDGVTYAPKIMKDEARIDWNLSAVQVERSIRAFNPVPGAWFELEGERIKLLSADLCAPGHGPAAPGTVLDEQLTIACNPGAIQPLLVQRAGRGVMPVGEMLRGFRVTTGTRLS